MADKHEPENGNGRKAWLTRDTFVPWGAVIAVAALVWWHATKLGDLERSIQANASSVAERVADQRRETSLEMQALKLSIEYQGKATDARFERLEKAVERLATPQPKK
jgi:hypothetical protein